jgi:site-specific recombinase XerD
MAGVPLANIADLMGHCDLATTQIYAKVQIDHLREAVSRISALVPKVSPGLLRRQGAVLNC